ncbi:hypothetical protein F5Y11DRAFT_361382 [Daldinia sp. FL1419]|nr:hypothetical protein F5Y11DRAFT_361382 [Daldinia sp. FL1419]
MFLMRVAALVVLAAGLPDLASVAVATSINQGTITPVSSYDLMQETDLRNAHVELRSVIVEPAVGHANQRRDAVHRCYEPSSEVGPVPSADDCLAAIKQLQAVQGDITVKLVEGCYHAVSGNCTASVCPQRIGTSSISPATAAQFLSDSVMPECISKGHRGWYLDRGYGIGVYLT